MALGQWVVTTGKTALVAATAKTAIELVTSANGGNDWYQLDIAFDGASGTAVPVLCELCLYSASGTGTAITFAAAHRATKATQAIAVNPPATTAKVNMTAEGTGGTVIAATLLHPQAGSTWQYPLGREFGMNKSLVYGVRLTAPAVVNYVVSLWFEE